MFTPLTGEHDDEVVPGLDSRTLAILLGVSYRMLDYAIRSVADLRGLPGMAGGSGSRRRFTIGTLRCLQLAALFADAAPRYPTGNSERGLWLPAVTAVLAGPAPPDRGLAILTSDGDLSYHRTLSVDQVPLGPVGVVIRYDLDRTPLAEHLAGLLTAA